MLKLDKLINKRKNMYNLALKVAMDINQREIKRLIKKWARPSEWNDVILDAITKISKISKTVKNNVLTLLRWDELDIASMWNSKTDWLMSDDKFKKLRLYEAMQEIKKDPDFAKFIEIFNLVKAEYNKDRNNTDIAQYINLAWIYWDEKILFLSTYWKIMSRVIKETHKVSLEPGMNNFDLNTLKENDAFFALWERDFNI